MAIKPNFLTSMGYHIFFKYGAPRARAEGASILVLSCSILSVYHSGTIGSQEITKKIGYKSKINTAENYMPCLHDNR